MGCKECKHRFLPMESKSSNFYQIYDHKYCCHPNLKEHLEEDTGWRTLLPRQACREIKSLCGSSGKWFEPVDIHELDVRMKTQIQYIARG